MKRMHPSAGRSGSSTASGAGMGHESDWSALKASASRLIKRAESLVADYDEMRKREDLLAHLDECVRADRLRAQARQAKDADEEVFTAFFKESGIRHYLKKFTDFAEERLDGMGDLEIIHGLAYNGALDMASYQFRMLEKKRFHALNDPAQALTHDDLLKQAGWTPMREKLTGLLGDLQDIYQRAANIMKRTKADEDDLSGRTNPAAVKRQLFNISNELDQLAAERGVIWKNLANSQIPPPPPPYEDRYCALYGALGRLLSEEALEQVASAQGVAIEIYKERLRVLAARIAADILTGWPEA